MTLSCPGLAFSFKISGLVRALFKISGLVRALFKISVM
jgi:hypothetical protein